MTYSFRMRFKLSPTNRLGIARETWNLATAAIDDETVYLTTRHPEKNICDETDLCLFGSGYETAADAEHAVNSWRAILQRAFAKRLLGADFGYRAGQSGPSKYLMDLAASQGDALLPDRHGALIYETEPKPTFMGFEAIGQVSTPEDRLIEELKEARSTSPRASDRTDVAFDLFAASLSQTYIDASFVLLVMAVEALIEPQVRESRVVEHVNQLISLINQAEIPNDQKESINGSLRWLKKESIRQSGRRLSECLGDRTYKDLSAKKFFDRCYEVRSRLVHGDANRPSSDDIGQFIGDLRRFVSDLLVERLGGLM